MPWSYAPHLLAHQDRRPLALTADDLTWVSMHPTLLAVDLWTDERLEQAIDMELHDPVVDAEDRLWWQVTR